MVEMSQMSQMSQGGSAVKNGKQAEIILEKYFFNNSGMVKIKIKTNEEFLDVLIRRKSILSDGKYFFNKKIPYNAKTESSEVNNGEGLASDLLYIEVKNNVVVFLHSFEVKSKIVSGSDKEKLPSFIDKHGVLEEDLKIRFDKITIVCASMYDRNYTYEENVKRMYPSLTESQKEGKAKLAGENEIETAFRYLKRNLAKEKVYNNDFFNRIEVKSLSDYTGEIIESK